MKMRWPRLLTIEPGEYDSIKFRLLGAVAAWLPFVFLIVILPSQLYLSNVAELEYKRELLYPYLITSLIILIALILIGCINSPWLQKLLDGLFFTGILAVLSGSFIPLNWGLMDGDNVLRESWGWGTVQVLIWLTLFVLWCYVPSASFRAGGAIFVAALVGWQTLTLSQIFLSSPDKIDLSQHTQQASKDTQVTPSQKQFLPNVYHIVFDAYSGRIFEGMAKKVGLTEELDGFTFFPNNLSNYLITAASGPSYLTGKIYKTGSFKAFQMEAKSKGLAEALYQAGYKIAAYTPNRSRFWTHERASQVVATSDDVRSGVEKNFALLSAVRAAPEFLREETERTVSGFLWKGRAHYYYYKRLSVPLMEKFLADEMEREGGGHYNYVHVLIPHGPYVWTGDCTLEERSDYMAQAECATRLMKRFVEELKALGRYDNSVIVMHSDHGVGSVAGSDIPFKPMPAEVKEKLAARTGYFTPDDVELRLNSLLLFKPPNQATRPFTVSPKITQLVDIPATVLDLVGKQASSGDGQPIFGNYQERDVSVFTGVYRRHKNGKSIVLGRNIERTLLDHLSYTRERGWLVLPDVEAYHEGW